MRWVGLPNLRRRVGWLRLYWGISVVFVAFLLVRPSGGEDNSTDADASESEFIAMEMVSVPAGTFMMGCNSAVDAECEPDEFLYHAVNVPAFKIDRYEVSGGLYTKCVEAGGCTAPSSDEWHCNWGKRGKARQPANCLDWNQAKGYCEWTGKRLCSESEWEKAARGTDGRKYPWGSVEPTCEQAVVDSVKPADNAKDHGICKKPGGGWINAASAVGSRPADLSPYGVRDMAGNVQEWVQDRYHPTYLSAPVDGGAMEEQSLHGSVRVVRGGGYDVSSSDVRASNRERALPSEGRAGLGFRCCSSL